MNALSIRNRFEYTIIGVATILTFGWLAYYLVQTEGDTAGFAALIVGLFGLAIGRQLIFYPPHMSVGGWCHEFSKPATVMNVGNRHVYVRDWKIGEFAVSFSSAYDETGKYLGVVHANDGDADSCGIPYLIPEDTSQKHLPWLARLRSPKLPSSKQAEVIDHDGTVVGHTTYKSS